MAFVSTVPKMSPTSYLSQSEIDHLWSDESIDQESLAALAEGHISRMAALRPHPSLIAALNRWAVLNVTSEHVWMTKELAEGLLGVVPVYPQMIDKQFPITEPGPIDPTTGRASKVPVLDSDGDPTYETRINAESGKPIQVMGDKPASLFGVKTGDGNLSFNTSKNAHNRPHDDKGSNRFRDEVLAGTAVSNGETWTIGSTGYVISAQHRGIGGIKAWYANPDAPSFPVWIIRNVPALFADTADTGRARTTADILARDNKVLELSSLVDSGGNPLGDAAPSARKKMTTNMQGVLRLLNLRTQGKNVNTSLVLRDGGYALYSHFGSELDSLINMVTNQDSTKGTGKAAVGLRKTLGLNNVIAGIVLAELSTHDRINDDSGIPVADAPHVDIDVEEWRQRLRECNSQLELNEGPLYTAFGQIRDANQSTKQKPVDKFASVLNVIAMMADVELDGWKPRSEQTYAIPKVKSDPKDKSFPCFGGADYGYESKSVAE